MTDSRLLPDHSWSDAEALVERVERAARQDAVAGTFFQDLSDGLRLTCGASTVVIWSVSEGEQAILSRSGVSIHAATFAADENPAEPLAEDHASHSRWIDGHCPTGGRLAAVQRIDRRVHLGIDLHFDSPRDIGAQHALGELVEVILDLASIVFLRSQLSGLRREIGRQSRRDALIGDLHGGLSPSESFALIAATIASESSADRVSLLRLNVARSVLSLVSPRSSNHGPLRHRLITTSAQTKIDRRSRQVRFLERLADTVLIRRERFTFTVGSPSELAEDEDAVLEGYLIESGCREIHIESVCGEGPESRAAIVLERFRAPPGEERSIASLLDPLRMPLHRAINHALDREEAAWSLLASRLAGGISRRQAAGLVLGFAILFLAACFVPATLKVSAQGRLVAAERNRLFAPADAIVAKVAVRNGQRVRKGDTLIELQSPSLELQQRNVQGSLSTARARMGTLLAARTRGIGSANRQQEASASADERVLKTEIQRLVEELRLLQLQEADLTINSPINGRVDRWNLQQSLAARPVTHGQYLLDVISESSGWKLEVDLPDKNIGYVVDAQRDKPCRCTFRLRSDPTTIHVGRVERIADTAHVDQLGQSMIRVSVPVRADVEQPFRSGATVIAQLHCGQRSIGFVLFRRVIEWGRTRSWL